MIDLDFLSISSSDNAGLSGANVDGTSCFATSGIKWSEKIKMTKIIKTSGIMVDNIYVLLHCFFSKGIKIDTNLTEQDSQNAEYRNILE